MPARAHDDANGSRPRKLDRPSKPRPARTPARRNLGCRTESRRVVDPVRLAGRAREARRDRDAEGGAGRGGAGPVARRRGASDLATLRHGQRARLPRAQARLRAAYRPRAVACRTRPCRAAGDGGQARPRAELLRRARAVARRDAGHRSGVVRVRRRQEPARDRGSIDRSARSSAPPAPRRPRPVARGLRAVPRDPGRAVRRDRPSPRRRRRDQRAVRGRAARRHRSRADRPREASDRDLGLPGVRPGAPGWRRSRHPDRSRRARARRVRRPARRLARRRRPRPARDPDHPAGDPPVRVATRPQVPGAAPPATSRSTTSSAARTAARTIRCC